MLKHSSSLFLTVIVMLIFTPWKSCFALSSDTDKPLKIVAAASLFNYKTGIDTYEGNVNVEQGSTHLSADKLMTERNAQNKLVSVIAYGIENLAELITLPAEGSKELHAKAKIIKFYPATSILELENDVTVTQGENHFQGSHIIYNMKDQMVSAPATKNGRTTIIIEPKRTTS